MDDTTDNTLMSTITGLSTTMDDTDSDIENFAKDMLERAKQRKLVLDPSAAASPGAVVTSDPVKMKPSVTFQVPVKKDSAPLKQIQEEILPRGGRQTAVDKDKEEIDKEEEDDGESDDEPKELSTSSADKSESADSDEDDDVDDDDADSHQIGSKTDRFASSSSTSPMKAMKMMNKPVTPLAPAISNRLNRTNRLTALANSINSWEDDLSHHNLPTSRFNTKSPPKARSSFMTMTPPAAATAATNKSCSPPKNAVDSFGVKISLRSASPVKQQQQPLPPLQMVKSPVKASSPVRAPSSVKSATVTARAHMQQESAQAATTIGLQIDDNVNTADTDKSSELVLSGIDCKKMVRLFEKSTSDEKMTAAAAAAVAKTDDCAKTKFTDEKKWTSSCSSRFGAGQITSAAPAAQVWAKPAVPPASTATADSTKTSLARQYQEPKDQTDKPTGSGAPAGAVAVAKRAPRPSCVIPQGTVQMQRRLFESAEEPMVRGPYSIPKGTVQLQKKLLESSMKEGLRARSLSPVGKKSVSTLPKYVFGQELDIASPPPPAPPPMPSPTRGGPPGSPVRDQPPSQKLTTTPKRPGSPIHQPTSTSSAGSGSPTHQQKQQQANYPGLSNIKKIRVSSPREGKLYPSLTDIEYTETEEDEGEEYCDEDMDLSTSGDDGGTGGGGSLMSGTSSLGTYIEKVAIKHAGGGGDREGEAGGAGRVQGQGRRRAGVGRYRPTEDFTSSLAKKQIIDAVALIDDALEGQDFTLDTVVESQLEVQASSTPNTQGGGSGVEEEAESSFISGSTPNTKTWLVSNEIQKLSSQSSSGSGSGGASGSRSGEQQKTVVDVDMMADSNTMKAVQELELLETDLDAVMMNISDDNDEGKGAAGGPKDDDSLCINAKDPISTSSPLIRTQLDESSFTSTPSPPHLLHTVSFYRKQQTPLKQQLPRMTAASSRTSPIKELAAKLLTTAETDDDEEHERDVQTMIKKLEDEITVQQRSIAQVTKALDLCQSTFEFSNSTESVECERVLLIATQKRLTLLNELHRVKTEAALHHHNRPNTDTGSGGAPPSSSTATLTLTNLTLPLKQRALQQLHQEQYHFLCLIKYKEQIEPSELLTIKRQQALSGAANELHFNNMINITGLEPQFRISIEIYGMKTGEEFLPHDMKYHIKKPDTKSSKMLTPKKLLQHHKDPAASSALLSQPFKSSPAPSTSTTTYGGGGGGGSTGSGGGVRSTNFLLLGSFHIDLTTLQRHRWTFDTNSGATSILEGIAFMDVNCQTELHMEQNGFLTLFNDVSGFGSWERRWCLLRNGSLDCWMYPGEENKQPPLKSISLQSCITTNIKPVSREICARPNTFLLITTRDPRPGDKETLTMSCHTDYTAIKHLISTDTREERDDWCRVLNLVVGNMRIWGNGGGGGGGAADGRSGK